MTNWTEEVDLTDVRRRYEADELNYPAFRDAVADRLSASRWAEDEDVRELINDLRHADTEKEFDEEMEYLYDRADSDNVWIGLS